MFGPQHKFVCKRPCPKGIRLPGAFTIRMEEHNSVVKVVESNLTKLAIYRFDFDTMVGERSSFALLGPALPGTKTSLFPIPERDSKILKIKLCMSVAAILQQMVPSKPFLDCGTKMWQDVFKSKCAHRRWFGIRMQPTKAFYTVSYCVRKTVPQVPPLYSLNSQNNFVCYWCKKVFENKRNFIEECAPDAF